MQHDINRAGSKISALSAGSYHKHLTDEKILPHITASNKEQAKFTYSTFRKGMEKQVKATEEQGKKQREAIEEQGEKQLVVINENIKKR